MSSPLHLAVRGVILGFLGVWLLLSIWHQGVLVVAIARKRRLEGLAWDVLGLVPFWCLWVGYPRWDCMLLYRDKLIDGQLTAWKNGWDTSPNLWFWIWSPQTRKLRTIEKWFQPLVSLAEGRTQAGQLFLSRIYVSAATYISGLQRAQFSELRQFMIVKVAGFDRQEPAEILFVSPMFRLNDEP